MRTVLKQSECEAAMDAISDFVLIADSNRNINFMNPTARKSLASFSGKDFVTLAMPAQHSMVREAAELAQRRMCPMELEIQGAADRHWYRLRIVADLEQGNASGFALHLLDIEKSKRTEREERMHLARRRERDGDTGRDDLQRRLDLMADALPVLISYVDRERRYQYNNASYERWFGTTRDALKGRTLEQVLGKAAYANIRAYVDTALAGHHVYFESEIPYKKAGLRQVSAHYVPDVDAEGEVLGFYALVEDVSSKKQAESALRQRELELRHSQKMEALGLLASSIAHEFNNLLQALMGRCFILEHTLGEDGEALEHVQMLLKLCRGGSSLTHKLLSFARNEDIQDALIDIDETVEEVTGLIAPLVGAKIKMKMDLAAGCQVLAAPSQLQQLLMNLCINARDAMPEGGKLKIQTQLRSVSPEEEKHHVNLAAGEYMMLSVSDTGTGMDEETRLRIFDPFFTTKPAGKGTGLGLSTVYGIVQRLAGHIEVSSAPGKGSTFHIYLPRAS